MQKYKRLDFQKEKKKSLPLLLLCKYTTYTEKKKMSALSLHEDHKKGATVETTETVSSSISSTSLDPNEPEKGLKRTLKSRHLTVNLISLNNAVYTR